uniref:Transmembrane protein n=1 Tax=Angiostrongylus cantonensis TaxID=6313 RepID=A0A0K0D8J7_ANGCA
MGAWQWGVRVSVIAGIIVLVLLAALIDEPKRGAAEEIVGAHLQLDGASSFWQDIKSLACIPTFLLCICAYAALVFVTGTLTWWEPTIIKHSIAWDLGLNDTQLLPNDKKNK